MHKTYTPKIWFVVLLIVFQISSALAQPGIGIPFGFTNSGAPTATTSVNLAVNAVGQDNSTIILTPTGFSFNFAGTLYQDVVVSTNGWAALIPASLMTNAGTASLTAATAAGSNILTVASTAGLAPGMYVTGTSIMGAAAAPTVGMAQIVAVTSGTTFTINLSAPPGGLTIGTALTYYTIGTAAFATALPTNSLSTYAGGYPLIAPLWDDLNILALSYTVGATTNIRWTGKWDKNAASGTLQFGASFSSANGNIAFFYPNLAYTATGAPSASMGIAGVCTGDFYSMTPVTTNTATVDSTVENNLINGSVKPTNVQYTFNPFCPNDNCAAPRPAKDLGTINTTCTYATFSNVNATTSGSNICSTTDNRDVWFKFTKPAGTSNIKISTSAATCTAGPGTSIEVFTTCGGTSLGCATTSTANPGFGEMVLNRPCSLEVLYVRVTVDGDVTGKFRLCVNDIGNNIAGITNGATCATATNICSLPFNQTGLTTAGYGNEYDSTISPCHDPYMNGEDYVFAFTPSSNTCIRVVLTSTGNNPFVGIFDGCPDVGSTHCVSTAAGSSGTITINSVTLLAGNTYYIVVDNNSLNTTTNIPFDINITSLGTSNTYDNCATPYSLGSIGNNAACVFSTFSTECSSPSPVGAGYPTPSCGNFTDGVTGDVWLSFTASFTGNLLIRTQPSAANSTADAAMQVYTGSCGAFSLYACDDNSAGSSMPLLSLPVINGTTYYIRVWTVNPANTGSFDLCLTSACAPPNDVPCTAVLVPIGATATGFNTCAGSTNEPPNSAQCTIGGIINTVWYKTVVPASGSISIRTHPLTLTDTQIQAFTLAGGCANAATTYVNKGCNDDGPDCGVQNGQSYHDYSELLINSLTPGDTIFIAVDGYNSQTGTFEITVVDGSSVSYAPVYMQDCAYPFEVCGSSNLSVPDPGPLNFGNVCDFSPTYDCWQNGERNSLWYRVTVNPGTLQFAINSVTDYDFIMWDVTGVSNACAQIQAHTLPSARCNWVTTTGQTGISTANPSANWEPSINVVGTRTYLILIDNWNPPSFVTGFTLDWMGSPIASNPTSVTWNGGIDTNFTTVNNWGTAPCNALPSCTVDAIISASASGRYPTMTVNTQVKNLAINSGATLRIKTGVILDVCGDFTNNGTLIAEPGSTVRFSGTVNQGIFGSLTGTNSFANLVILKTSGTVTLNCNIDVSENFSTASATSIFNVNAKYMRVGGDFSNSTANTTFTGYAASTLEFNGSSAQHFTNSSGSMVVFNVVMNKPSGNLYLTGANSTMNIDSTATLTLTKGLISTRAFAALEVNMKNKATNSIVGHNTTSYIDGKLRRPVYVGVPLTLPLSIDFPVGDTLTPGGYELANVTFTSGTTISNLLANFSPWPTPATPPAIGPTANECMIATYNILPLFNDGYWTITKGNASFNGIYKITLNSLGHTNNVGTGWTVVKADQAANPSLTASWGLIGQCVISSTQFNTIRVNINGTYAYAVTTTIGSNIINTANTTALSVGAPITGTGIPVGSVITSILNSGAFTISNAATATGSISATLGNTASAGTSFNALYSVAQSTVPLPIKLLTFTADHEGENIVCHWITGSETNNDHFDIERSFDGETFEKIGKVNGYGAGVSTTNRSYSFEDPDKCHEIRYYRLRQVDIDGQFEYSETVAVNCISKDQMIQIHPNPAYETITYQFSQANDEVLNIRIIDVTGRILKDENVNAIRGFNSFNTPVSELPAGVYYLHIRSNSDNPSSTPRQVQFMKN
ncbi:MAG: T9SS type A sorting domain-containing protein [Bacteroidetes bacterium]|nr:T9SS type A sorting domain-containing protein [Bacteroidota bacterium]